MVALLLALAAFLTAASPALAAPAQQGPTDPPSLRAGQALFQENCAACHGASGGGDGPTAAELPQGATALADPAVARVASPAGWFEVVKEGRMDLFMPPWKNRLSDEQIWDVVAYAFSLHSSEAELQQGQAVWEQACAACHGAGGAGDGPQAAGLAMPNLADPDLAASRSPDAWYQITSAGQGEMPSFAGSLSEDEIWAALAYARSFSFPPLEATAVPTGTGQIVGRVLNGTTGDPMAGLTVSLNPFESFTELPTVQAETSADGEFVFGDLPTGSEFVYLLTADYGGNTFGSDIVSFADGQDTLEVPLQVYETSATAGEITVSLAQWFIDSHQGALLVGELYRINHDSDRVFTGGEEIAPGRNAVLRFNLPPEATSLVLDGGEIGQRFILTDEGVVDTQPLLPGGSQILLRYLLPYDGTRAELAHSVPYPVERLNVLVVDGPEVTTGLQSMGPQTVADQQWNSFETSSLPAGEVVSLSLSGLARAESQAAGVPGSSAAVLSYNPNLLYAVGGLALLAVLGVFTGYLLRKSPVGDASDRSLAAQAMAPQAVDLTAERARLLASIAQMDDQYAAGELEEASYLSARSAQKRRLLWVDQQLAQPEQGNQAIADGETLTDGSPDAAEQAAQ